MKVGGLFSTAPSPMMLGRLLGGQSVLHQPV
jgi:hypothetical protein